MKKFLAFCAALLMFLLCTFSVLGASSSSRVEDKAGLLSAEEETRLREKLDKINAQYGMDVLIVTLNTYPDYDIAAYCERYFTENGRGSGPQGDGIMLALCMGTREYYECTHGRARSVFSERELIEIENRFVPLLSAGNYSRAFNVFANRVRRALWWEQVLGKTDNGVLRYVHANQDAILQALLFGFIGGLVISVIRTVVLVVKLKSVRPANHAENYVVEHSFHLTDKQEIFTHKSVSRTQRYEERSNGGGGGFSAGGGFSGGSGGGGGSFGGHGGHF